MAWDTILDQPAEWYRTAAARALADAVVLHQRPTGGWPKDVDMTRPPPEPSHSTRDSTIDNGATTTQIRFLARVGDDRHRAAAIRGVEYLLAAQYPNGGWPQFYPLKDDYSRHITFNDNAMVNAATVLDDVSRGGPPFEFVDEGRRRRAAAAVARAVAVIVEAQVVVDGVRTAWCAQHDAVTLEPRGARSYEHPSLSGSETVGIVRFLMRQPRSAEVVRAVDSAVAWLTRVRLADGRWARFYEIGTNRPIFSGRDGRIRYDLSEIEQERRDNYAWHGTWGKNLLEKEYPRWKRE